MSIRKCTAVFAQFLWRQTYQKAEIYLIFHILFEIVPSGVQKHFYAISGSRAIRKLKWGYQIFNFLDIGQFSVSKYDVSYCLTYILTPLCFTEMGLNLKHAKGCSIMS